MAKKAEQDSPEKSVLKTAAVAIGNLAGKAVVAAESVLPHAHQEPAATPRAKKPSGKLPPKNKTRLPRRQKKALARKANRKLSPK